MGYQERYGAWAGNPAGKPPDRTRCCAVVYSRERWSRAYQCERPRGHGPNGDYCKQHDPAAQAARDAKARAREAEAALKWRKEVYGPRFYDALLAIANGHNDPRSLAIEVLSVIDDTETQP